MDIEEIKKFARNKIEAGELTKQVRRQIKETTWEKQNLREGFSETFKPLISQFEKPVDPKKKNIFTQNQEMLQNQLALTEGLSDNQLAITEGLKANQKAITDGFSQFERLADMKELPEVEANEDEDEDEDEEEYKSPVAKSPVAKSPIVDKPPIVEFDVDYVDRYLNNKKAKDILESNGYVNLPSFYFDKDNNDIYSLINVINSDLNELKKELKNSAEFIYNEEGYEQAESTAKKRGPNPNTKEKIDTFNTLSIYSKNLNTLFMYKKQSGYGLFSNPEELLHRFELLAGSLSAGNNGVLPEYIQIAHRLRDLGILSNKQLNTLLRKIIKV